MMENNKTESESHRLFRKMTALKMNVGQPFIRQDGKEAMTVNGDLLTVSQLLELDKRNELTSWGIKEFAEKRAPQKSGQ